MDINKLQNVLMTYARRLMAYSRRKSVIAAIAIVLILSLVLILNSVLAKKPVLSVSSNVPVKKSVKNSKPTDKKTKIADSNQALDVDKIIDIAKAKGVALADSEDEGVVESNEPIDNETEEVIDEEVLINKPVAAVFSGAEPEPADLSANLGDIKSGIQSLVFMRSMPIADALQLLAARYGQNVVPMTKIDGSIGFTKLNNVSFDEAMNAILGGGFKYQQDGNIVKVYAAGESDKKKPQSEEKICKVFTLYYITAAEARKMVMPVMSNIGKIEITSAAQTGVPVDETVSAPSGGGDTFAMNDMMVIYDYPENMAQVEKIIAAIDIRPKQVLVEATILTATLTDGMQFGIDWRNLNLGTLATVSGLGSLGVNRWSPDYIAFGGSSTNVSASISGGMTVGVVRGDIAAFIRAVEEITDVTILANPKILAANKQLGQVYIGTKLGYLSSTSQTDTSTTQEVSFLDTGTKLSFRPFIGNDGYIRMDIHPKDSSAAIRQIGGTDSTTAVPDETSAELVSNIIVKDGETIVIGGLFRNKIHTTKKQVPMLGNIPIIGGAFKSNADETKREEVIILLTPHIIEEPQQARGDERAADVARKSMGAKEELHFADRMKIAQNHYEKAALYYAQGRNSDAIKELEKAIELYPAYLEAIQLEEKIYKETNPAEKPVREVIDEVEQPRLGKWRRR